jgi:transposase
MPGQAALPVPEGATREMVVLGQRIYHGQVGGAACTGCHGESGEGTLWVPPLRAKKGCGATAVLPELPHPLERRRLQHPHPHGRQSRSFVPDVEQRLWRTITRKKYQLRCDRVRLQNQVEAHIKLSSLVTDLLGVSARRMLKALAEGETNPAALAALADERLRATPEQLCDALGACTELNVVYRRLLKMALEELRLIDEQIGQLDQEMASLLSQHQDAVERLAEVPGLGVDSAQQIIAEVGPTAATFPSEKCLSSWVGACPGDNESAGVNYSHRSPKGNRHMRRLLNQAANAAARTKGSIFDIVYRRSVPRLGHNQAIGAIAHRQCRLIWLILHQGVRYEERGPAVTKQSKQKRTARMIRQLRNLGYRIESPNPQPSQAQAQ